MMVVVFGIVMNRLNVSLTGLLAYTGVDLHAGVDGDCGQRGAGDAQGHCLRADRQIPAGLPG